MPLPLEAPLVMLSSPTPIKVTVVNGSVIMFTIAPVNYNKFTTTIILMTIPAQAFYCSGKSSALQIQLQVSGTALPISMSVVTTMLRSASATSIVSGSPASATSSARVSMLQSLLSCRFDPTDVTYGNSLTGFLFGPRRGAPVRGAIIGNMIVFFGISVLVMGICVVTAAIGNARVGSGFRAGFGRMLEIFHFPSLLMLPAAAVMQPTISAACTLLVYNPPLAPYDRQFAGWALLFILSFCCWVTYILTSAFGCVLGKRPAEAEKKGVQHLIMRVLDADMHWKPKPDYGKPWKQRMLLFFADFKYPKYALLDMWMSVVLGVTSGLVFPLKWVCSAQLLVCIVGYTVLTLVVVVLRPGLSHFTQGYLLLSNLLGLISSSASLWASSTQAQSAVSTSIIASMLISVIATLKSVPDVLLLVMAIPHIVSRSKKSLKGIAQREKERLQTAEEEMRNKTSAAHHGIVAIHEDEDDDPFSAPEVPGHQDMNDEDFINQLLMNLDGGGGAASSGAGGQQAAAVDDAVRRLLEQSTAAQRVAAVVPTSGETAAVDAEDFFSGLLASATSPPVFAQPGISAKEGDTATPELAKDENNGLDGITSLPAGQGEVQSVNFDAIKAPAISLVPLSSSAVEQSSSEASPVRGLQPEADEPRAKDSIIAVEDGTAIAASDNSHITVTSIGIDEQPERHAGMDLTIGLAPAGDDDNHDDFLSNLMTGATRREGDPQDEYDDDDPLGLRRIPSSAAVTQQPGKSSSLLGTTHEDDLDGGGNSTFVIGGIALASAISADYSTESEAAKPVVVNASFLQLGRATQAEESPPPPPPPPPSPPKRQRRGRVTGPGPKVIHVPGSGTVVSGSGATYAPVWLGPSDDHDVESELGARSNGPTSRSTADEAHVGDDAEDEDIL